MSKSNRIVEVTDEQSDKGAYDANTSETLSVLQEVVTIATAYLSNNALPAADLPGFITSVYESVTRMSAPAARVERKTPDNPAVAVKRSVTKDYIVCLEDGRKFKSLRRHLSSFHDLTPDAYRAKWSLPRDYPMVAPAYAAVRSRLARDAGLGQMARQEAGGGAVASPAENRPPQPAPAAPGHLGPEAELSTRARRGRPRKEA